jgi:arabinofuranan 3-O-arabinosyltransferase
MGDLTGSASERPSAVAEAWRARLPVYGTAIVLSYALILAGSLWQRHWLIDADGYAMATDFIAWWSAGRMAIAGQAADIYDWTLHKAVQVAAIGRDFDDFFGWLNPPHFLLVVTPFALPDYVIGFIVWVIATAGFLAAMLRLVVPGFVVPILMAAPATLWCAASGQNGFLTAGLMAGCLALLQRAPWLAGFLLGLLTVKPQFGLLFPLFLLLDRRWTAFAAATVTTAVLALASLLVFGADVWFAFLDSTAKSNDTLLRGGAGWSKLQSLYALVFQFTGNLTAAMASQVLLLLGSIALLIWMKRRDSPYALRASVVVAAAYLVTPYVYIYDAVLLTTSAAFLVQDGLERGFRRHDVKLILVGCLMPGAFMLLGSAAAPLGCAALLAAALRRCQAGAEKAPQSR